MRSRRPSARTFFPKAGLLGHIGKRAISVVAVEAVLSEVGAEDIVEAIVVIVGDANAVGPANCPRPALSVTSVNVPSRLFL